ncbi:cell division protein FtsB [Nonlabens dokdonensis]|jgi:cell division protein FtsB|uniref:Uridine kinase n=2 Tax=Nonlabens dokdonensis TaxID=328515 RepID=L7WEV9_NONDD|nr:septum formation initiator family protein [Nonlabens dokdonensis]AGC78481.1 uridine kinase [Nonlabens dokdonensis DSW-6]PZX38225.1 cell division protein FtsB [Nonlabens dokdonensis]
MGLKNLKTNPWWRFFSNKYTIITILFAIWILFLDGSAWTTSHRQINKDLAEKQENADFYRKGIARDKAKIAALQDSAGLEKFARERYLMKRDNEEVFIIQHPDSVKTKSNE